MITTTDPITVNGETLIAREWAKRLNTDTKTVVRRVNEMGWTPERAASTPVRQRESIAEDGYWENRILSYPKIKEGEEFTLKLLAKWMKKPAGSMHPHIMRLYTNERLTRREEIGENGGCPAYYRIRLSASKIIKKPWRTTNNDWLGLEPRLGVEW